MITYIISKEHTVPVYVKLITYYYQSALYYKEINKGYI
jgi:hypothetical protein